jgi:hypothetical protein
MREEAVESNRDPKATDHVHSEHDPEVAPVERHIPQEADGRGDTERRTMTAISVTTCEIRLVRGRTVPTGSVSSCCGSGGGGRFVWADVTAIANHYSLLDEFRLCASQS